MLFLGQTVCASDAQSFEVPIVERRLTALLLLMKFRRIEL